MVQSSTSVTVVFCLNLGSEQPLLRHVGRNPTSMCTVNIKLLDIMTVPFIFRLYANPIAHLVPPTNAQLILELFSLFFCPTSCILHVVCLSDLIQSVWPCGGADKPRFNLITPEVASFNLSVADVLLTCARSHDALYASSHCLPNCYRSTRSFGLRETNRQLTMGMCEFVQL